MLLDIITPGVIKRLNLMHSQAGIDFQMLEDIQRRIIGGRKVWAERASSAGGL